MLSSAGLSGVGQAKEKATVGGMVSLLAPPPGGASKLRSPLPPPPNDPAVAKISKKTSLLAPPHEKQKVSSRGTNPDTFSDLSSIEV
jgi:adaptin ear-binding coat-associated protein 1/2